MCRCCRCDCDEIKRLKRYVKLLEHTNETLFEQKMRYTDVMTLLEAKLSEEARNGLNAVGFWENNEEVMKLVRDGKLIL